MRVHVPRIRSILVQVSCSILARDRIELGVISNDIAVRFLTRWLPSCREFISTSNGHAYSFGAVKFVYLWYKKQLASRAKNMVVRARRMWYRCQRTFKRESRDSHDLPPSPTRAADLAYPWMSSRNWMFQKSSQNTAGFPKLLRIPPRVNSASFLIYRCNPVTPHILAG